MASNSSNPFAYCHKVTPECPVSQTIYTYEPNLAANAFFAAFFALCTACHLVFGIKWRTWTFMTALVLGCACELVGYIGRILLHNNAWSTSSFSMQIICLIIAPAFIAAGVYLSLKHFVLTFGERYSPIRAKWYTWTFITADIVSLIMQGAGAAITATGRDFHTIETGEAIAIAGICWQVASLVAFGGIALLYVWKVYRQRHQLPTEAITIALSAGFRFYCFGLMVAYITILIRCIYRIPELAGGWRNAVMLNETAFIVLDSVTMILAAGVLTIAHPGYCFRPLFKLKTAQSPYSKADGEGKLDETF